MTRDSSGSIVAYGKFYEGKSQFPFTIADTIQDIRQDFLGNTW